MRRSIRSLHHYCVLVLAFSLVVPTTKLQHNTQVRAEDANTLQTPPPPPQEGQHYNEECSITSDCRLCSTSDKNSIEECEFTGKVQVLSCIEYDGEEIHLTRKVYESCKRTPTDEEYLMLRLQVFCLLIGVTAFVSGRRQKAAGATLYDQRKQAMNNRAAFAAAAGLSSGTGTEKRRSSDAIGMTSLDAEMVPLAMNNNTLEVV